MNHKNIAIIICTVCTISALLGCAKKTETEQTTAEHFTAASKEDEISTDGNGKSEVVNPLKEVSSSEDFKTIGLSLAVPELKDRFSNRRYHIIDGEIAQIQFYDETAHSEAVARAGKEELGDFSGLYYNFDDSKEEQWTASTGSGDPITIRVRQVVDGSDIPGVLATWNYKGVNYTLWEDEGKKDPGTVAKTACEIATLSADATDTLQ